MARALLLGLSLLLGAVAGQPERLGVLRGRIETPGETGASGQRPAVRELGAPPVRRTVDRRQTVVYLETAPRAAFEREEVRAQMDQRDETFLPRVVAVPVGGVVDFPNNDAVYHNVFSLSRAKSFDLGRYGAGRSKSVRFDRPGIVRVFCDIHSHMSAFILVFSHRFFAVTDEEGRYRIPDIPPGTYVVRVWHETLPGEQRTIVVPPAGGDVELSLTLGSRRTTQ
jgi:plastocyanin